MQRHGFIETVTRAIELLRSDRSTPQRLALLSIVEQMLKDEMKSSTNKSEQAATPWSVTRWYKLKADALTGMVSEFYAKGWSGLPGRYQDVPEQLQSQCFRTLNQRSICQALRLANMTSIFPCSIRFIVFVCVLPILFLMR